MYFLHKLTEFTTSGRNYASSQLHNSVHRVTYCLYLRPQSGTIADLAAALDARIFGSLTKSINNQVKKVANSYVSEIAQNLFQYNIIRGRDILAKAIFEALLRYPYSTPNHTGLPYIINSNFPKIGHLICKRLISSLCDEYMANEEEKCFAHLINQRVILFYLKQH